MGVTKNIAIVLAAGRGSRLSTISGDNPKQLLKISKEKRIIDIIFDNIVRYHSCIERVLVVVGYKKDLLKRYIDKKYGRNLNIDYVSNDFWKTTGTGYSLMLGLKHIMESHSLNSFINGFDIIVINGDTLVQPQDFEKIVTSSRSALLVDPRSKIDEDAVKVYFCLNTDKLVVSKKVICSHYLYYGEYIGISKISERDIINFFTNLEKIVSSNPTEYYDVAFGSICPSIIIVEHPWVEVDYPEDYRRALKIFNTF